MIYMNYLAILYFVGSFGGGVQESSTFANLASQSTVGFGSLAQGQQSPPPAQVPQFSG